VPALDLLADQGWIVTVAEDAVQLFALSLSATFARSSAQAST
jgi:hypothetical protein